MSETRLENETTIVFNEAEDEVMIWSASPVFQRKMERIGVEPYKTAQRDSEKQACWYRAPKSWVTVRKPREVNLTDEQRQVLKERFSAFRAHVREEQSSLSPKE